MTHTRTRQEIRVGLDILEAIMKEAKRKDRFVCRGFEMEITPEIDALVKKALDSTCHGEAMREDPHDD